MSEDMYDLTEETKRTIKTIIENKLWGERNSKFYFVSM